MNSVEVLKHKLYIGKSPSNAKLFWLYQKDYIDYSFFVSCLYLEEYLQEKTDMFPYGDILWITHQHLLLFAGFILILDVLAQTLPHVTFHVMF